uniref:Uncharacterized protein n=1 Tax=Emiliania huxleyi TaxID=2903 RepID=A0A7S3X2M0_EMIHU
MNWEGGGGGWAAVADWAQGGDGLSSCRLKGRWHLDAALVYGSVKLCGIAFNARLSPCGRDLAHAKRRGERRRCSPQALCVQRILSGNLFAEAVGGDQLFGLSHSRLRACLSFLPPCTSLPGPVSPGLSNLPFLALSRTLRFVRANLRQADLEYAILCANTASALLWWSHARPYFWGYMPTPGDSVLFWALIELLGLAGTLRKLWLGIEGVELLLLRRFGGVRTVDLRFYDHELRTYM